MSKAPSTHVLITRAEYEALWAAVKALVPIYRISLRRHEAWDRAAETIVALRAVGIQVDGELE